MANAMAVIEIARVDASMSTFLLVHSYLCMLTINLLVGGWLRSAGQYVCPGAVPASWPEALRCAVPPRSTLAASCMLENWHPAPAPPVAWLMPPTACER